MTDAQKLQYVLQILPKVYRMSRSTFATEEAAADYVYTSWLTYVELCRRNRRPSLADVLREVELARDLCPPKDA